MRVGTDIIKIERIAKSLENSRFKESVFSKNEIEYAKSVQTFAGMFAAKEAYLKALGTGIDRRLNTVEIGHEKNGRPFIVGAADCDVSVSHDGEYAIATVIIG